MPSAWSATPLHNSCRDGVARAILRPAIDLSSLPSLTSVRILRLPHNPDLPLPSRQTAGAAGYDVCSAEPDLVLQPNERRAIATGLVFELPEGMEMQVRPRSGLALKHGLTVPNAPGTIDPDYRGELKIIVFNLGAEPVPIRRGDRIAQLIFARFETPALEESDTISATERGQGGFGSTGAGREAQGARREAQDAGRETQDA